MSYKGKENKIFYKKYKAGITVCLLLMSFFGLLLGGCGTKNSPQPQASTNKPSTGFVVTGPESFDSADTAILVAKKEEEQSLTFYNLQVKKRYTLSYDGTTRYADRYGQSMALSQIQPGQIVDVTFLKDKKHLTTLCLSSAAWSQEQVTNYEFDFVKRQVSIGSDMYQLVDTVQYLTEDGIPLEESEIHVADELSFYGLDTKIYSIRVNKGHGYLRLVNDENFIGGWIEIGKDLIQKITPEMLITVTEGRYKVGISHNGSSGIKDVVINRNAETVLDIGDIEVVKPKEGTVLFSLVPSSTKLYIDGTLTDTTLAVTLEYGLHQLIAKADGYKTLTQYIRVGQDSAGVEITLEEENGEEETSSEDTSEDEISTTGYKVHIDGPKDVEVYVDSNYVGLAPCSFEKKAGNHVITLRKSGYTTRSYTITVDEEQKDISYSFADLVQDSTTNLNTDALVDQIWSNILTD